MRAILKRLGWLAWLAASGPGAWKGLGLFALILTLEFVGIWLSVQMINWSKAFYDALEQMDAAEALRQVGIFGIIVGVMSVTTLIGSWLTKWLRINWRQNLTDRALALWLDGGAYWHLRPGLSANPVENPDQRIAEDCNRFIEYLLSFSIDLITRVVSLVTYLAVLWNLSNFPLPLDFIGIDAEIPRYMVWAAFVYVFGSSLITHFLGRPIKNLSFRQERREADFRHALVQVRDRADEIAQSGGEGAERRRLDERFHAVRTNWRRLIGQEFIMGLFVTPYYRSVLRIPTFLALPAYFGGAVTLGGLMQMAGAFSRVTNTLSWFIFRYERLARFVAVSERLEGLFRAARAPDPVPDVPRALERRTSEAGLRSEGLQLYTPLGVALAPVPDMVISPGQRVWLRGASGQGKTTLLSALRGVWPYGVGTLELPDAPMMALPQVPLAFADGMLQTLTYPHAPSDYDPAQLEDVLRRVGLAGRIPQTDGPEALQGLSVGERQRLALARAVLLQPEWLLIDEATSALDPASEAELLDLLRRELPRSTILCVAHRPPVGLQPDYEIHIGYDEERKSA
ncbi:ABC transporter ATP-binding protein/permease [Pararhodobacter oceanensis]|uniref:ABC transporter permease n=1 Tax=Pararhodobacter oceanensis TaxID=2172121 RepID=A0A2T8HQ80_9RHOB|nr:SbmA/BacA-like family transporter [Pararhodobacter oceanensis]PVH27608.1 ABC transporter permease [Pararhodobacter oceanensis]